MTDACQRAAAFALILVIATGTPAVAGYDDFRRIELAGQPADIFVTGGVAQDISMRVPYRVMTRPEGSSWPPYYGSAGIAAGTVATGVTVHGSSGPPTDSSPPNAAVYIGSLIGTPGVYDAEFGSIHISSSAPAGLAVIQLYSISDEAITKFRPIGALNVYIQAPFFLSPPNVGAVRSGSHPPTAFRMSTTTANVFSNWATIDSPYTNWNRNARVLVTHNWGYPCGCRYNDHPLGVWYTGSKWAVFNQDGAPMPVGTFFNVMVEGDQEIDGKIHLATSSNSVYETTYDY